MRCNIHGILMQYESRSKSSGSCNSIWKLKSNINIGVLSIHRPFPPDCLHWNWVICYCLSPLKHPHDSAVILFVKRHINDPVTLVDIEYSIQRKKKAWVRIVYVCRRVDIRPQSDKESQWNMKYIMTQNWLLFWPYIELGPKCIHLAATVRVPAFSGQGQHTGNLPVNMLQGSDQLKSISI